MLPDIRNPSKPVEISRWWMAGQNQVAGEPPHPRGRTISASCDALRKRALCRLLVFRHFDHRRVGHRAPAHAGRHEYDPPHPEPTHTFLKVPFPICGRSIAVSTEEERPSAGRTSENRTLRCAPQGRDRSDPAENLCTYQLEEQAQPYHGVDVRFGTHQLREIIDQDCMLHVTWFAAGLRFIDISDPSRPQEKGYFIPQPTAGAEDDAMNRRRRKDDRGLIS